MSETDAPVVVFQSNKFFWRTRNSIDVTIVQYNALNVTEIISYEPSIDKEAPRIYLNSEVLLSKLNYEEMASKVKAAKQRNVPQTAKFKNDLQNQAIADYILNRLFVSELSRDSKLFSVKLQFNFRDRDEECGVNTIDQIICEKPEALKPIDVVHHRIYTPAEVAAAYKAVEDAQRTLQEQCNKAMQIQAETSALEELSMKERWRIPIVLSRIVKNRRLSEADSRIWAAVSRNMTSEEAVEKLTRVTMRASHPALPASGARGAATPSGAPDTTEGAQSAHAAPTSIIGRVFAIRSTRLFAPTVSSQNRFTAEEPKAKGKPLRKLFERGYKHVNIAPAARTNTQTATHSSFHNTTHNTTHATTHTYPKATKKVHRRGGKRKHRHRAHDKDNDAAQEEQKGGDFDHEEEDEKADTFVDHIAAGLATFASALSSKFSRSSKVHTSASSDDADSTAPDPSVGGKKQVGGSITFREIDDIVESTEGKPMHTSVEGVNGSGKSSPSSPQRLLAGTANALAGAGAGAMQNEQDRENHSGDFNVQDNNDKSESVVGPPSPTKRAFFGPFLASLSRKNTNNPANLGTLSGKASDEAACEGPGSRSTHSAQSSPKPSPTRFGSMNNFFGSTLNRLMSWSAPQNQVVPAQ